MKKILAIVAMTVIFGVVAKADIGIYANAEIGYIGVTGAINDNPSSLFSGSVMMQLIWSQTAGYSSATTAVGGGLDVGFVELFSGTISVVDGLIPTGDIDGGVVYQSSVIGQPLNTGYVYARVFNTDSPIIGSYYLNSTQIGPGLTEMSATPPPTPDALDIGTGSGAIDLGGYYVNPLNIEVVPEPSVLAFLGLGGLALAVRRRFVA